MENASPPPKKNQHNNNNNNNNNIIVIVSFLKKGGQPSLNPTLVVQIKTTIIIIGISHDTVLVKLLTMTLSDLSLPPE